MIEATQPLTVAISSRALFNFEEENRVFEQGGDDAAYMRVQLERMDVPARAGVAFPLIKKLLSFNVDATQRVEVVILSRNDPVSGLRVYRSAKSEDLAISRAVFTRGRSPYKYLTPLRANLFLSANEEDVRAALQAGFPAARVYPSSFIDAVRHPKEVRIAFDGDAVLFSDEAEQVYQRDGLPAFHAHEAHHVMKPLPAGPFKPFLQALNALQASGESPVQIRTALVTARSAPAHERAIRTLMDWNIGVDEAMFLGGMEKAGFLKEFEPDMFFDDQTRHCDAAAAVTATGHVTMGVMNKLVGQS
jgi:5'-nucleotidase